MRAAQPPLGAESVSIAQNTRERFLHGMKNAFRNLIDPSRAHVHEAMEKRLRALSVPEQKNPVLPVPFIADANLPLANHERCLYTDQAVFPPCRNKCGEFTMLLREMLHKAIDVKQASSQASIATLYAGRALAEASRLREEHAYDWHRAGHVGIEQGMLAHQVSDVNHRGIYSGLTYEHALHPGLENGQALHPGLTYEHALHPGLEYGQAPNSGQNPIPFHSWLQNGLSGSFQELADGHVHGHGLLSNVLDLGASSHMPLMAHL